MSKTVLENKKKHLDKYIILDKYFKYLLLKQNVFTLTNTKVLDLQQFYFIFTYAFKCMFIKERTFTFVINFISQVLCSDSNDVAWIASNTTLTSSLVQEGPENLVIGGITSYYDLNQVYIGKFSDSNGNAYVGNVYRQYYIYWADELDQPKYSEYYELLITTENRTSKNSNKDSKN